VSIRTATALPPSPEFFVTDARLSVLSEITSMKLHIWSLNLVAAPKMFELDPFILLLWRHWLWSSK